MNSQKTVRLVPRVVEGTPKRDLHAQITTLEFMRDGYGFIKEEKEYVTVHVCETTEQYQHGVIRFQTQKGENFEIGIDALMSVIFSAYDPPLLRSSIGVLEHFWMLIRSEWIKLRARMRK